MILLDMVQAVLYIENRHLNQKEKAEPKPEVTVKLVNEEETSEADLAKLGLTNDENV